MPNTPSPFKLVSAALYQARHPLQATTYDRWRAFLKRLEGYRGTLDPIADQSANLDVLLRAVEENIDEELALQGDLKNETAGFQLHLHLSRLWVLGTYEFLRTLHLLIKQHSHPAASCMRETNSKGCGEATCACCAIGHIKNETALVRMVLAKNEKANDVCNPPLTDAMRIKIGSDPPANPPAASKFLCNGEGQVGGIMAWYVYDKRVGRHRIISRLDLSERVLNGLNGVDVIFPQ